MVSWEHFTIKGKLKRKLEPFLYSLNNLDGKVSINLPSPIQVVGIEWQDRWALHHDQYSLHARETM